jgi:hypothetical protein
MYVCMYVCMCVCVCVCVCVLGHVDTFLGNARNTRMQHIKGIARSVFVWSAPYPLLEKGSLNTFPQNQMCEKTGHLLLGNSAGNRLCQQYMMCFLWVRLETIRISSSVVNQKSFVEGERGWSESSAGKEEGFG